jgi:Ras-related protein Rab-1A
MEENPADYIFKIIIVGSSGVGKSALLLRYTDAMFYTNNCSTIGVDYKLKTLEVLVNQVPKIVKLQLWDTAGQDRFRTLAVQYLRGAHAAIVVFSLEDIDSFKNLDYWIELIQKHGNNGKFFLIGSKCDLPANVTDEMIKSLCEKHTELTYIRTSAKTGENINELFETLATDLANKQAKMIIDEKRKNVINLERDEEKKGEGEKRKCCGGT